MLFSSSLNLGILPGGSSAAAHAGAGSGAAAESAAKAKAAAGGAAGAGEKRTTKGKKDKTFLHKIRRKSSGLLEGLRKARPDLTPPGAGKRTPQVTPPPMSLEETRPLEATVRLTWRASHRACPENPPRDALSRTMWSGGSPEPAAAAALPGSGRSASRRDATTSAMMQRASVVG